MGCIVDGVRELLPARDGDSIGDAACILLTLITQGNA